MPDTGRMIPTIKSDRARPWIEFWGDWLYRIDVPERVLALPLGDVCSIYHVHHFDLGGLLLSPYVRLPGFLVNILALQFFFLVFGI